MYATVCTTAASNQINYNTKRLLNSDLLYMFTGLWAVWKSTSVTPLGYDIIDGNVFSNEACHEFLPKKICICHSFHSKGCTLLTK